MKFILLIVAAFCLFESKSNADGTTGQVLGALNILADTVEKTTGIDISKSLKGSPNAETPKRAKRSARYWGYRWSRYGPGIIPGLVNGLLGPPYLPGNNYWERRWGGRYATPYGWGRRYGRRWRYSY